MTAQPKISRENSPSEYSEVLNRLRQEPAISMQNSAGNSRPEPTLDEAREDLARAIGEVAHSLYSPKNMAPWLQPLQKPLPKQF